MGLRDRPILLNCANINEEVAQPLRTSLTVHVSQADTLLSWLDGDDAGYITDLLVFVDVYYKAPSAIHWNQLFQNARTRCNESANSNNLLRLRGPTHTGLGNSIDFVRAVKQLRVKGTITTEGSYAQPWSVYAECKTGYCR
jgi:hypothetical protein